MKVLFSLLLINFTLNNVVCDEQNVPQIGKPCELLSNCDLNEFCAKNKCQCQPNYKYDKKQNVCVFRKCSKDKDCNTYDKDRKCNKGNCDCKKYYSIDLNTKFCRITVRMNCGNNSVCTQSGDKNQVCMDSVCLCKPNYRITDENNNFCTEFKCIEDSECQTYDKNRVCDKNNKKCVCDKNSKENNYNTKCELITIGINCTKNSECTQSGDKNQVCMDSVCRCKPNYRKTAEDDICKAYNCVNDFECGEYDINRVCDKFTKKCVCTTNSKENIYNKKCELAPFLNTGIYLIWILVIIIICFLDGIAITCYVIVKRRRRYLESIGYIDRTQDFSNINVVQPRFEGMPTPPPPYSRN